MGGGEVNGEREEKVGEGEGGRGRGQSIHWVHI